MKFTINLSLYDMFRATPDSMEMGDIVASLSLSNKDYVSLRMKDSATINKRIVTDAISKLPVDHENKKFYLFLSTQGCTTKRKSLLELLSALLPSIAAITSYLPFEEIILVPLNYTVQKEYELSELSSNTLDKLVTLDVQFKHFKTATIDTMFNVPALSSDVGVSDSFITDFEDLAVTPRFEFYGSSSAGPSVELANSSFITAAKEILGDNLVTLNIDEVTPTNLLTVLDNVNSESLIALYFTNMDYSKISNVLGALVLDAKRRYNVERTFRFVVFGQKISTALTDLHVTFNSRKDCEVRTRFDFEVEDLIKLANTIATNAIETTYFNPVKIEEKPTMYNNFSKLSVNLFTTADSNIRSSDVINYINQLIGILRWEPLGINKIANTNCWVAEKGVDGNSWLLVDVESCALESAEKIVDSAIRLFTENVFVKTSKLNIIVTGGNGSPTAHHFSAIGKAQFLKANCTFNVICNLVDIGTVVGLDGHAHTNQFPRRAIEFASQDVFAHHFGYHQMPHHHHQQHPAGWQPSKLPGGDLDGDVFVNNHGSQTDTLKWDINIFQPSVQLIADKINNGSYSIFGHEIYIDSMTGYTDLPAITSPTYIEKRFVFGSPVKRKVISPTTLVLPTTCDKAVSTPVPVIIKIQDKHYTYLSVKENEDVGNRAWILLIELDVERDLESSPYCDLDSVNMF